MVIAVDSTASAVVDPQIDLAPQTLELPQRVLLPQSVVLPQTDLVPLTGNVAHIEVELQTTEVVAVLELYVAVGERALPEKVVVFARAAAMSKYPAPIVNMSYWLVKVCPVTGSNATLDVGKVL
jgi:hypothetical protein